MRTPLFSAQAAQMPLDAPRCSQISDVTGYSQMATYHLTRVMNLIVRVMDLLITAMDLLIRVMDLFIRVMDSKSNGLTYKSNGPTPLPMAISDLAIRNGDSRSRGTIS